MITNASSSSSTAKFIAIALMLSGVSSADDISANSTRGQGQPRSSKNSSARTDYSAPVRRVEILAPESTQTRNSSAPLAIQQPRTAKTAGEAMFAELHELLTEIQELRDPDVSAEYLALAESVVATTASSASADDLNQWAARLAGKIV